MKKTYINPEIAVVEVELQHMIAESYTETVYTTEEVSDGDIEDLGKESSNFITGNWSEEE